MTIIQLIIFDIVSLKCDTENTKKWHSILPHINPVHNYQNDYYFLGKSKFAPHRTSLREPYVEIVPELLNIPKTIKTNPLYIQPLTQMH